MGGGQCFLGTEFQFGKISEKVLEMAGSDGYKKSELMNELIH